LQNLNLKPTLSIFFTFILITPATSTIKPAR
jgi:hypothetical protein